MSRVPLPAPDAFTPAQAELYALYTSGTRARPGSDFSLVDASGQLIGPPASWMLSAPLGLALERLGREIRFALSLPPRSREIVILSVAEAEDSPFERYAHERAGLRSGLSPDELRAIAAGDFTGADAHEAAIVELTAALLSGDDVGDDVWERATAELGQRAVFEVVTLVGYYRMMALQLRAYRLEPPV